MKPVGLKAALVTLQLPAPPSEKLLLLHAAQVVDSVAPVAAEYMLEGHGMHDVEASEGW
jgi:hypothetical protein